MEVEVKDLMGSERVLKDADLLTPQETPG